MGVILTQEAYTHVFIAIYVYLILQSTIKIKQLPFSYELLNIITKKKIKTIMMILSSSKTIFKQLCVIFVYPNLYVTNNTNP
jgi:hypothetical protein